METPPDDYLKRCWRHFGVRRHRPKKNWEEKESLDDDGEIVNEPVGNWRALVDAALRCQNVDLMVRDQSRPNPPADSGWTQLPSLEPSGVSVPGLGEQTTPRQSTTYLPQQLPNTSVLSISGSTLSPSTESFETAVNTSEVSLPTQAAADTRSQPVHRGIYYATSRKPTTSPPRTEYSIPDISVPSIGGRALTDPFETAINTSDVSLPQSADDQTTSRQTNPNIYSNGGSTPFSSSSTESFEGFVNTSEVSRPVQSAVGQPPQFVDSEIVDQTIPIQPVTRLPQLEPTNAHACTPSLGGSTLVSTDSLETLVNTPEAVSLPTAAGKRPQSIDSGIGLQVEVSTPDTLITPPPSAPHSTSPVPEQDQETQSARPVRKRQAPGNWFQKYVYNYETWGW